MDAVKELAGKAGHGRPRRRPARPRAGRAHRLADRRHGGGAGLVRRAAARASMAPRRATISTEARHRRRRPSPASASASRPTAAPRSRRALAQLGEDKLIETGMLIQPEDGGGHLRPLPRPADDPDPRPARPGHRASAAASSATASPNISTPPRRRSSTRAAPSTTSTAPAPPAAQAKRLIVVEGYMDVIALDRAGIAEVVAPNGTARHRGPARAHVAARSRADPLLRRRRAPGRKAAIRAAAARPPPHRPRAHPALRRAARRPGSRRRRQLRRQARRSRRCSPSPSRSTSACGATSATPAPLTTPEARAGLRQRLIEHTPGDRRPRAAPPLPRPVAAAASRPRSRRSRARPAASGSRGPRAASLRRRPPLRPPRAAASDAARAIGAAGIDRATARALILGFAQFPAGAARPYASSSPRLADRRPRTRRAARPPRRRRLLAPSA